MRTPEPEFGRIGLPRQLIGRTGDIEELFARLQGREVKIVPVHGPPGVGKTALVKSVRENAGTVLQDRFASIHEYSCWDESWTSVIANLASQIADASAIKTANVEALEQVIIETAQAAPRLIILDNLVQDHQEPFQQFADRWLKGTHQSVLISTSVEPLVVERAAVAPQKVDGLWGSFPLELFGNKLRTRFEESTLLDAAARLQGVPLNILYVRWLDPSTPQELTKTVDDIILGNLDLADSLENVLLEVSRSPIHFMVIGIVRQLEFDEALLAFLWDNFNGGAVEAYTEHRQQLIRSRVLVPVGDSGSSRFRVNEQVHMHLARLLEKRIVGKERLQPIHYLVSEYFRRNLDGQRIPALDALQAFVYHSLESGESGRAYRIVSEQMQSPDEASRPRELHALGQTFLEFEATTALILNDILEMFREPARWNKLDGLQQTRILIELAHVASDLGRFDECIDLTGRAGELLDRHGTPEVAAELWRRIWYYQGVSYSNTGHCADSARAYFKIVESSPPGDHLGALCLGYMAHALLYIDLNAAIRYGGHSVRVARAIGNPTLLAKNLTSHAEVLVFSENPADAHSLFAEAHEILLGDDHSTAKRELGRTLKNWGVLALAQNDLQAAAARLTAGLELSRETGDHRRVASGEQYLAILMMARGEVHEAVDQIASSIRGADITGNGRYLVPALLTLSRWMDPEFDGGFERLPELHADTDLVGCARTVAARPNLTIFRDFWRAAYWPLLCERG